MLAHNASGRISLPVLPASGDKKRIGLKLKLIPAHKREGRKKEKERERGGGEGGGKGSSQPTRVVELVRKS